MKTSPSPTSPSPGSGILLGASMMTMGLIAGVYYSFSIAVMPGLARADDRTLITVMQRINVAIVNPAFAVSFFGTLVLTTIAAVQQWRLGRRDVARWVIAALAVYIASLIVTAGGNIPLNDSLVSVPDSASPAELAIVRQRFENPWVVWNIVRGALCTVALGFLGQALVLSGKEEKRSV
jgi:uncharacterized membrane protein